MNELKGDNMSELKEPPVFKSSNVAFDMRVVGHEEEVKEFIGICKVIQQLGRSGANRTIQISVDGDGSGRLAFYGIDDGEKFTDFNSNGIDVDNLEEMYIGE